METNDVGKLVQDINIIKELIIHPPFNWSDGLLIAALIAIVIAIFTIINYSKGRDTESGKIDARMQKLDQIIKEQEKITNTVEQIKSDIEKGVWLEKEKNLVQREKIFEMMSASSRVLDFYHDHISAANELNPVPLDSENPVDLIIHLNILFFESYDFPAVIRLETERRNIWDVIAKIFEQRAQHYESNPKQTYSTPLELREEFNEAIQKLGEPITSLRKELGLKMKSLLNSK